MRPSSLSIRCFPPEARGIVKDHNKNRIVLITDRYAARRHQKQLNDSDRFEEAFRAVRDAVIRPVLEEITAELRNVGHAATIAVDQGEWTPSIELLLGIRDDGPLPGHD